MPIYEYQCPKCQNIFEELVFGDAIPPCSKCGHTQTLKLISRATLHTAEPSRVGQTVRFPSSSSSSGCGT